MLHLSVCLRMINRRVAMENSSYVEEWLKMRRPKLWFMIRNYLQVTFLTEQLQYELSYVLSSYMWNKFNFRQLAEIIDCSYRKAAIQWKTVDWPHNIGANLFPRSRWKGNWLQGCCASDHCLVGLFADVTILDGRLHILDHQNRSHSLCFVGTIPKCASWARAIIRNISVAGGTNTSLPTSMLSTTVSPSRSL